MVTINSSYSIEYISSGLFTTEQAWIHPKRIIDSYEIILVLDGDVFIQQEETKYHMKKGDVLLLSPDKLHFGYCESKVKVSFYWLHFYTDFFSNFGLSDLSHFEESYRLVSLFKQLLHMANTPGYLPNSVDLYVALILCELEFMQKKQSIPTSVLAKQMFEWIRVNTDKNITVIDVAKHFGYNENYISKLFKKNISCWYEGIYK